MNNAAVIGISMSLTLVFAFVTLFLRDHLKVSNFQVGAVIGLSHVVSVTLSPVVGSISDAVKTPWGRRRPFILTGAFVSALLIALMPWVGSYWLFLLVIAVFFVFSIASQVPFYALIPELAPAGQRGEYTVYIGLLRLTGFVVMMGLGSVLWRTSPAYTFYLAAVFVLFSAVVSVASVREPSFAKATEGNPVSEALHWMARLRAYVKDLLAERRILAFFTAQAWWWFGLGALIPFGTILLKEFYHVDITQFVRLSPVAVGVALLLVVFVILAGVIGDKVGHWAVITGGLVLLLCAAVLAYFAAAGWLFGVVVVTGVIGASTLFTEPLAFLAEIVPRGREGEFYGFETISVTLTQVPAALAGGAFIDWLGHASIFGVVSLGLVLALVFMIVERRLARSESVLTL